MDQIQQLISQHINIWTSADSEKKSSRGRSSSNAEKVYGIEKLRELILNLAIHGNLVPQYANDEPASELLKRIESEQIKLLKGNKQKPLRSISNEETPFKLPRGWSWVRNSQLFQLRKGKIPKNLNENEKGLPYLDIEALDRNVIRRYSEDNMCPTSKETDILVVCDGSRSGLILNGKCGIIGSTLSIIDTPIFIQPFIKLIFKQGFKDFNTSMKGAAIPHLDTQKLLQNITALPPLPEQLRIVSKVDELMALCEQLEQQHINSEEAHDKLVVVLLHTLTQSEDAEEFENSWQRIANHFDILFVTENSVDELKHTLLHLAVMGKLVAQDPNDESAIELLKRIQAEKAKLLQEGKLKKEKSLPPIAGNDTKLPKGWVWSRFQDISIYIQRGKGPEYVDHSPYKVISQKCVRWNGLDLDVARFISTKSLSKYEDIRFLKNNDLLWNSTGTGTIGRACLFSIEDLDQKVVADSHVTVIRSLFNLTEYLFRFIQSPLIQDEIEKMASGSTNQIELNTSTIMSHLIPLPPLQEQDRIVKKLNELIALCDELKSRIHQASEKQKQIADVLVSQALH